MEVGSFPDFLASMPGLCYEHNIPRLALSVKVSLLEIVHNSNVRLFSQQRRLPRRRVAGRGSPACLTKRLVGNLQFACVPNRISSHRRESTLNLPLSKEQFKDKMVLRLT
jgi:hypothetical protein